MHSVKVWSVPDTHRNTGCVWRCTIDGRLQGATVTDDALGGCVEDGGWRDNPFAWVANGITVTLWDEGGPQRGITVDAPQHGMHNARQHNGRALCAAMGG